MNSAGIFKEQTPGVPVQGELTGKPLRRRVPVTESKTMKALYPGLDTTFEHIDAQGKRIDDAIKALPQQIAKQNEKEQAARLKVEAERQEALLGRVAHIHTSEAFKKAVREEAAKQLQPLLDEMRGDLLREIAQRDQTIKALTDRVNKLEGGKK